MNTDALIVVGGRNEINGSFANRNEIVWWDDWNPLHGQSLPEYCETNRFELTKSYLEVINILSKSMVGGLDLRDQLNVTGVKFWELSSVRESSWTNPFVISIIKLLALREILIKQRPSALEIYGLSVDVLNAIYILADELTIATQGHAATGGRTRAASLFAKQSLRALGYFLISVPSMLLVPKGNLETIDSSAALLSYVEKKSFSDPKDEVPYNPSHMNGLSGLIRRQSGHVNTLLLHSSSSAFSPKLSEAWRLRRLTRRRCRNSPIFLATFITRALVNQSLKSYLAIYKRSWRILKDLRDLEPHHLWFLSVLENELIDSLVGPKSLRSAVYTHLFNKVANYLGNVEKIFYPAEGQDWEAALYFAFDDKHESSLIGYVHSLIKPWDLRLLTAHKFGCVGALALHGPWDDEQVKRFSPVAADRTVKVEALRYKFNEGSSSRRVRRPARILFLGSIDSELSNQQYRELLTHVENKGNLMTVSIRPHPFAKEAKITLGEELISEIRPLEDLLELYDVVVHSSGTTQVAARLIGFPSVLIIEEGGLDISPIRNDRFSFSSCSIAESLDWIQSLSGLEVKSLSPSEFFRIDIEFPLWKRLLSSRPGSGI